MRKPRRRADLLALREAQGIERLWDPKVARSFAAAVAGVRANIKGRELLDALAAGDRERAISIVDAASLADRLRGGGLEPGIPSFVEQLTGAMRAGAVMGAKQLPPDIGRAVGSLDLTNPRALEFLESYLPEKIREVTDGTRRAVEAAVQRGFDEGYHPSKMAREIRDVVGLTEKQSVAVENFRRQLEEGTAIGTGTEPKDRRLSAVERSQAQSIFVHGGERSARVNALVDTYHQRLVNRRAKNIARTETHRAQVEGQLSLWSQAADQGLLDPQETRTIWIVTPDERLRDDHARVPFDNPDGVPLGGYFQTVVGPVKAPGTSGDPGFDVNCRCTPGLTFSEAPMRWNPAKETYIYA